MMNLLSVPSPNFNSRPEYAEITMLVLHYTGMKTKEDAIARLCDEKAEVSSHYLIDEKGEVIQLVNDEKRAWHAGISCWRGRASVNDVSIGIEIVNPGHEFGYRPFPEEQMLSVIELCKTLKAKYKIEDRNIVGHSDIATRRKQDPGELFDWQRLAKAGIGLWPKVGRIWKPGKLIIKAEEESTNVATVQKMLADYGYHIRVDGYFGFKSEHVVKAFKRHFVPEAVDMNWDRLADARLSKLLQMVG